jgi:hypothetical protein
MCGYNTTRGFEGEALERLPKRLGISPGDGKMSYPPPNGILWCTAQRGELGTKSFRSIIARLTVDQ